MFYHVVYAHLIQHVPTRSIIPFTVCFLFSFYSFLFLFFHFYWVLFGRQQEVT